MARYVFATRYILRREGYSSISLRLRLLIRPVQSPVGQIRTAVATWGALDLSVDVILSPKHTMPQYPANTRNYEL